MADVELDVAEGTVVGRLVADVVDDIPFATLKTALGLDSTILAELIRDTIGAAILAGTGIALTVDDAGDTITIATTSITETVQDVLGALTGFGGSGLTFTYDDAGNAVTLDVNVDGSSIEINADTIRVKALGITNAMLAGSIALSKLATDPLARANHTGTQLAATISDFNEAAQDAVGGILTDSATIDFTYDDASNTITAIVIDATITNAKLANMAQATIKGRAAAAGTGAPVDLTAAQVKTILAIVAADISDFDTQVATTAILKSLVDAKGDILTATADNTPARLAVGADDRILMADAAAATGMKWVPPATPSTQAFGDAAAEGTADTFVRGDHKHAMPSLGTGATNATAGNDSRLKKPTRQILTVGSGTYNTPAGCTRIVIRGIAGGAGGGGSAGSATQAAAASGGASGGWFEKTIDSPASTYAYTVGAKGAGGTAGANPGSAGSDTTFSAAGSLLTAKGGVGGVAGALGTTVGVKKGGSGGGISTDAAGGSGSFLASDGQPGAHGIVATAAISVSGYGGSSPLGAGGPARSSDGAGMNATGGYGGGGGGAAVQSVNTARAGGDGADGVIVVDEYYGT